MSIKQAVLFWLMVKSLSIVGVTVIQVNREGSNILLSLSSSETLVKVILVHLFQWTLESSVNINYAAFNSTNVSHLPVGLLVMAKHCVFLPTFSSVTSEYQCLLLTFNISMNTDRFTSNYY